MSTLLFDQTTVQLVREDCIHCGNVFGMSQQLRNRRQEDRETFWCPGCGGEMVPRASEPRRLPLIAPACAIAGDQGASQWGPVSTTNPFLVDASNPDSIDSPISCY